MKKFDYLNKEEVKSFLYTTASEDRQGSKIECINGRMYEKYGTYQAVTFVGKVYRVLNKEKGRHEYVLHIGLSKQHPDEGRINKQEGVEIAVENCLIDPFAIINLEKNTIKFSDFMDIVSVYLSNMDLKFIRTKEEKNMLK